MLSCLVNSCFYICQFSKINLVHLMEFRCLKLIKQFFIWPVSTTDPSFTMIFSLFIFLFWINVVRTSQILIPWGKLKLLCLSACLVAAIFFCVWEACRTKMPFLISILITWELRYWQGEEFIICLEFFPFNFLFFGW